MLPDLVKKVAKAAIVESFMNVVCDYLLLKHRLPVNYSCPICFSNVRIIVLKKYFYQM